MYYFPPTNLSLSSKASINGDSYIDIGGHVHTIFWSPYMSSILLTDGQNLLGDFR